MIKKSMLLLLMLITVSLFSQTSTSAIVKRGPYLQSGTSTSVMVKWRTDIATASVVNYGTKLDSLFKNQTNKKQTTEHEVLLSGLLPNTKYYFNIGNQKEVLSESISGDMYVVTAPKVGTDQFVRAWILGDPGTDNKSQRNVRDAYYKYVDFDSINPGKTDMMLLLGDNAYSSGTDEEYKLAFFDVYNEMLKKSVAWSCLGNHDGYTADSDTQSGPYYDIFTFPKKAEAGGIASGTEAYYSFNYANIHFIILDSHHSSRAIGDAMYNWALSDIQNTKQDWIVTLFHHPAYSKGSHDSDVEDRLIEMRENFMPMLEANGIDLVLNGHSHSYERSYFLNGHHGFSNTFNANQTTKGGNIVSKNGNGDGKINGNGAYKKTNIDTKGAVYITTGSSGQISGGELNHKAMYISLNKLGSCVMEIDDDGKGGQNLTVKFLRDNNEVDDYFTINKSNITVRSEIKKEVTKSKKSFIVPINGLLTININPKEKLKSVKFYNTIGQLIKESKHNKVNVKKMELGTYVLEITTDKKTFFKSVLLK